VGTDAFVRPASEASPHNEQGIEAAQQKEKAFFELAERFRAASDPEQVKQLGNELGRFVFGE
jgi:hypothetical protein